jgi:hypothetical protein
VAAAFVRLGVFKTKRADDCADRSRQRIQRTVELIRNSAGIHAAAMQAMARSRAKDRTRLKVGAAPPLTVG